MGELVADDLVTTGDAAVAAVRAFNRFYTNMIGLLRGKYLDTPYSLTEARILFELAQRDASEVTDLRHTVDIDAGYLSRIMSRFESDGLISRQRSAADGRRQVIRLTDHGRSVVAALDGRSAAQTRDMLAAVRDDDRRRLLDAMHVITDVLSESPRPRGYLLRAPRAGDMGWVVQRNGAVYAEEFGSPRSTGPRPGACSACARTRPPRGCAYCWSSRGPEDSGSALAWSRRCSGSPARPGTATSRYGPTTCWPAPGGSTSGPVSPWTTRAVTTASAKTWSGRTGPGVCKSRVSGSQAHPCGVMLMAQPGPYHRVI
jgi:DNA-binding MarR family transcriptional regulator